MNHTIQDIIAAVRAHGQRGAARELGIPRSTLQDRLKRAALQGYAPDHDMTKTVPDGYLVKGVSTYYDKEGKPKAQWVKSAIDRQRMEVLMERWIESMMQGVPRVPVIPHSGQETYPDLMAAYIFGDPHVGMLSWNDETGSNWDLEIAKRVHIDAMAEMVERAPAAEAALVVNLGDLCHQDSMEPKTPASGHILDADGRYARMVDVAFSMMRTLIEEALRKHKQVHVISIQGNHDETSGLNIAKMLAIAYEKNQRVTVDTSPSVFRYHRFGENLIGIHHGHKCKPAGLPAVMQNDERRAFAATENHYWHVGHFHHADRKEYADCIVEVHNTLAARDAYAHNGGWRSKRSAVCIIYDKHKGEDGRFYAYVKKDSGK